MALLHSREEALQMIRTMPEGMFTDGLLLDCPKRRRREQAMNKRPMLIKLPPDQKKRLATQMNRYIELLGKDLGIEIMLRFIEGPTNVTLTAFGEDGHEETLASA
jgi:hypothetical protein